MMYKILLVVILSFSYQFIFGTRSADRVIFFNVGQGDSMMIQYQGRNIFIDGGPEDNIVFKLQDVLEKPVVIDILILTHYHDDHYSGVLDILERYNVAEVYMPNICEKTLFDEIGGIDLISFSPGEMNSIKIGDGKLVVGVAAQIEKMCVDPQMYNNASLVAYFQTPNKSILMMGDAEKESEFHLLKNMDSWGIGKVDILKAGHHCSSTSSSKVFLEKIIPEMVVCSAGKKNRFGHPSKEVLDRFVELNIDHLVTWKEGNIEIPL